ncbi:ribonuclease P protein component [Patescibacteria group bacterium]
MLQKQYRLTKNKEFEIVASKGKAVYSPVLLIKNTGNNYQYSRFGIIVSNKVSKKASQRNLIKRRIREIIKQEFDKIEKGKDIVIIASPKIINDKGKVMPYEQLETYLLSSFKKANLL